MSTALVTLAADLAAVSLVVVMLWVLYRGYQIAAGNERANMTDFVYKSGKIVLILALINGVIALNPWLQDQVFGFRSAVVTAVTGSSTSGGQQVQNGLSAMDLAFSLGNVIDGNSSSNGGGVKSSGVTLALLGQASPQIAGGALLLANELSLRIGILLLPLFLFFLIFERTQDLFYSWARTMFGSFFNMAILAITVAIAAELVGIFVAALSTITLLVQSVPGQVLSEVQGSILQSGFGIMLSVLIFTIPYIAGKYFTFILDAGGGSNMFGSYSTGNSGNYSNSSSYNASAAAAQQSAAASRASQGAMPSNVPSQGGTSNPITGNAGGGGKAPP